MDKFNIYFFVLLMLICSGFSAILYEDNQNLTNQNYNDISIIASSEPSLAFDTMSDVTYNFQLTTTPMYILLSAGGISNSENITISYYDTILENFINKNYVIPKDDTFIIELKSQNIGDKTSIILSNASGNIFYSYVFANDNQRGVGNENTIFTPLISGVITLIDINISIWKVGYYLLISGLILGAIGSIVLLGFKFYNWADTHSIYNNKNTRK